MTVRDLMLCAYGMIAGGFLVWLAEDMPRRWWRLPLCALLGAVWPLTLATTLALTVVGDSCRVGCKSCRQGFRADVMWAAELRWLAHTLRRPECRSGRPWLTTLVLLVWTWRPRWMRRRRKPVTPAPTINDPPLELDG